jgi:predicted glycosyltransferase
VAERVQLGYYVHHHGAGHAMRALAIARHLNCDVTLIGSQLPDVSMPTNVRTLPLPGDTAEGMHVESFPALHYAPLAVAGLRERMGLLADWMRQAWPCVLVVDVSVEVAMLARLFGVPCVYMRQHGLRSDPAHLQAYASASMLLAPYPAPMESLDTPAWVHDKTCHSGWISRYATHLAGVGSERRGRVLVLVGQGGTAFSTQALAEIARACPAFEFRVAGPLTHMDSPLPANLHLLGRLSDPLEQLLEAEIVVGSAGDNVLAEVASLGKRYIAIAEQRPFDEQRIQARQLDQLGVAIGLMELPRAVRWPELLQAARALPGQDGWRALVDREAARAAATAIERVLGQVF